MSKAKSKEQTEQGEFVWVLTVSTKDSYGPDHVETYTTREAAEERAEALQGQHWHEVGEKGDGSPESLFFKSAQEEGSQPKGSEDECWYAGGTTVRGDLVEGDWWAELHKTKVRTEPKSLEEPSAEAKKAYAQKEVAVLTGRLDEAASELHRVATEAGVELDAKYTALA